MKDSGPELLFHYSFEVNQNRTYNFIFLFPFDVIENIDSTEGMNFTKTPHGTLIWLKYPMTEVIDWKGTIITGKFRIANTFQSGTKGDYSFSLPLTVSIPYSNVTDELQRELSVGWVSPVKQASLTFVVPENLKITQATPQNNLTGPTTHISSDGRIVNTAKWEWLTSLDQQFTVVVRDAGETQYFASRLFLSGIFLSLGLGIIVRTTYDWGKSITIEKEKILKPPDIKQLTSTKNQKNRTR